MYLSNYDSYGNCSNPCYTPSTSQCPMLMNPCPSVCQPQVIYQPYYIPQPILPQPVFQQPIIQQGPQLQYNWTPSNIYNMRWPIQGPHQNPL